MNCDTLSVPLGTHTRKHLDLLNNYQLFQLIDEPTRVTENSETCVPYYIKFWRHFNLAILAIFQKVAKLKCTKIECR